MLVVALDVEIRGVEIRTSKEKQNQYAVLKFEDNTGSAYQQYCPDIAKVNNLKKGDVGDLYLNASFVLSKKAYEFEFSEFVHKDTE